MSKIEVNTIDTQCGANLTVGAACKSVTIAGNDIRSNNYKASDGGIIISQSGTNITLGASGDTISLASGATQTGFGRTGTVDWDTTAKTANFTAVSGNGYFVNTTSGAITVTLPATPSAGDIVAIKDYANTADTNNITIARNGSNMDGTAEDGTIENEGGSITLVYVDATKGWLVTDAAQKSDISFPTYITATGGTITTCGDFKIHTFTSPGTFCVSAISDVAAENTVGYLVVAGGGGSSPTVAAGGGGGGGFREGRNVPIDNFTASPLVADAPTNAITLTVQGYPITVGGGGSAGPGGPSGNGSNSVFSTITSAGGGGAGSANTACGVGSGGSGGGGGGGSGAATGAGSGNTPPVNPPQGQNGGAGVVSSPYRGSGGGGASQAGCTGSTGNGGNGGNGATTSIPGSPITKAGGGGAHGEQSGGTGGSGGGGNGSCGPGSSASANTGGGGGGLGGSGGSGIVVIRYKYQ